MLGQLKAHGDRFQHCLHDLIERKAKLEIASAHISKAVADPCVGGFIMEIEYDCIHIDGISDVMPCQA